MAVKVWELKNEEFLETSHCEVRDRRVKLEHTPKYLRWLWLIGGLPLLAAIKGIGGYLGPVVAFAGLGILLLIETFVKERMTKDLHLLFYTERDAKHDDFFALDLSTNDLLYVQHIFSNSDDEYPATLYGLEHVTFDQFKNYVSNCSARHYEKIKDISASSALKTIQFGEIDWRWVWFTKYNEGEDVVLGCFRIAASNSVQAKYARFSKEKYAKKFGECLHLQDVYAAFVRKDLPIGTVRHLNPDEIQIFTNVFNGDTRKCQTPIEKYFCKDFVIEYEYSGNATVSDYNGTRFLNYLQAEDASEPFSLTVFDEEQLLKEEIESVEEKAENTEDIQEPAASATLNNPYKKYGIACLICSIAGLIPLNLPATVAAIVLGNKSIKYTDANAIERDRKAVIGRIVAFSEIGLLVLGIIGSFL
ncbi:MAG: DUF4190 domain-containing protein [Ruminococcaceae bacterium]|nr:DUF4190 domain-containing protein [Oscillospiraceae bacterium]